jgi:hypothetical protein
MTGLRARAEALCDALFGSKEHYAYEDVERAKQALREAIADAAHVAEAYRCTRLHKSVQQGIAQAIRRTLLEES